MADLAARRAFRLPRDVPALRRRRVDDELVPAAHEHHGIARRDAVELAQVRQALLMELRLVPVAVRDDELAGRRALRARLYRPEQRVDAAHAREVEPGTAARVVQVAVDQAGDDRASLQIDLPRGHAGRAAHGIVRADGGEAIAADRHRLRDREGRIDGDDLAVVEHELGRLGVARRGPGAATGEERRGERQRHSCHRHHPGSFLVAKPHRLP